jgi:LysM repeat protein
MKKVILSVFSLFILIFYCQQLYSQTINKTYVEYIEKYAQLAQKQQSQYGIPASIILAQGLLESSAGKSWLALNANNHFGIKCSEWKGESVSYTDDKKNECFRKYSSVIDSYQDHSEFIKNRPRYASLFGLSRTDYEGWAHGLKKAGYATDDTYAYKLISLIDNYELHKYDIEQNPNELIIENNKPLVQEKGSMGYVDPYLKHTIMKNNNVRYVVAVAGDTWGSIADEFNMNENRILKFNDVQPGAILQPGEKVYLQTKKRIAEKKYPLHEVKEGETMYLISQEYGILLRNLYDINGMSYNQGPRVGQVLKLRN